MKLNDDDAPVQHEACASSLLQRVREAGLQIYTVTSWLATTLLLCLIVATPAGAAPVDCTGYARTAETARQRARESVTREEAATQEVIDAAKRCLANIDRAANWSIPGVRFNIDLGAIAAQMINRACQVVTSRIDEAGRVVTGTVSGWENRVITPINQALPLPTGPILTPGPSIPITPGPSPAQVPVTTQNPAPASPAAAPQPSLPQRLNCMLTQRC